MLDLTYTWYGQQQITSERARAAGSSKKQRRENKHLMYHRVISSSRVLSSANLASRHLFRPRDLRTPLFPRVSLSQRASSSSNEGSGKTDEPKSKGLFGSSFIPYVVRSRVFDAWKSIVRYHGYGRDSCASNTLFLHWLLCFLSMNLPHFNS